jgi:hypothetical protein
MPRGQKPKQYAQRVVDAVARLYAEGKTQHEVAAALGMTQKVIFNIMRRHGITARVAAKRNQWGENNHAWKGDDATKKAFHRRLYSRHGKPDCCLVCGTISSEHYDYANVSGRYEDLDDYIALCRSCHWRYDGKVENITNNRRDADDQAQSA